MDTAKFRESEFRESEFRDQNLEIRIQKSESRNQNIPHFYERGEIRILKVLQGRKLPITYYSSGNSTNIICV